MAQIKISVMSGRKKRRFGVEINLPQSSARRRARSDSSHLSLLTGGDTVKPLRKIGGRQIVKLELAGLVGDGVRHKNPDRRRQVGGRVQFIKHARRAGAVELKIAVAHLRERAELRRQFSIQR